jgi:putative peptidoglycan lipid II flippase
VTSKSGHDATGIEAASHIDVVARHAGLVRRTALVSALTLASRIIGFARESLAASIFGDASAINDAFVTAWRVPNLFRGMLGEGAMSTSFQTELTRADAELGLDAGRRLFLAILRVVLLASIALCAGVMLFVWLAPDRMPATGWTWLGADPAPVRELILRMMPFVVCVCLSAVASGALFVRGRYLAPSLAPVLMNVWWIGALFIVIDEFGFEHLAAAGDERLRQLAIARRLAGYVLIAGAVLFLAQVPTLVREKLLARAPSRGEKDRSAPIVPSHGAGGSTPIVPLRVARGSKPNLSSHVATTSTSDAEISNEHVWRVLKHAAPLALGAAVYQVNAMIDGLMAQSLLPSGGPSVLYYATRVQQLPLSLISLAATSAVFPVLSALGLARRLGELRALHERTQLAIAFVALPATLGLCALASPVMAVCFEHGAFGPEGVERGAQGLRALTLAILPAGAAGLAARTYYSMGDMRTPVRIASWMLALNAILSVTFIKVLGMDIEGLALATGVCAWGNLLLLVPGLRTRLGLPAGQSDFLSRLVLMAMCAVGSATAAWLIELALAERCRPAVALACSILVGAAVYAVLVHALGIPEWRHLWSRLWSWSAREPRP